MNALVSFRGNALGNLSVTRKQRLDASAEITSTYRARMEGIAKSLSSAKSTESEPTTTTEIANNELGRDAFLQLLVLELQNQDPLEPVDNAQMIAQLAQFSSLEQMESLNSSFETLSGNMDQLNFLSAQGMLGRHIEGINGEGEAVTGTVNAVYLDGSIVVLNVDGEIVPMSNVLSVTDSAPESDTEGGDGEDS